MADSIFTTPCLFGDVASLPSATSREGHVAIVGNDGSGKLAFYRVDSGAWALATIGSSVAVTLAGDVTGASGANTVVGLTGSTGTVAMHGNGLVWDIASSPSLTQNTRTTDAATVTFDIRAQSAFASATGTNRNGAKLFLSSGTAASGGTNGSVELAIAGVAKFTVTPTEYQLANSTVRWTEASTPLITQSARTTDAVANDIAVYSQNAFASATGVNRNSGSVVLSSGGPASGGTAGTIQLRIANSTKFRVESAQISVLLDDVVFVEGQTAPRIMQAARTTDTATSSLTIRSQAPFPSAATNLVSGDIHYEVPGSVGDPPNPGAHRFYVNETEALRINYGSATLVESLLAFTASGHSTFLITCADATANGHDIELTAGRGGGVAGNGGSVVITPGQASGSGAQGLVALSTSDGSFYGTSVVTLRSAPAQHILGIASIPTTTNVPTGVDGVAFIGNAAAWAGSNPTGGFLMASVAGVPTFRMSSGAELGLTGVVAISAGAPGPVLEVLVNGSSYYLQLLNP